MDSLIRKDSIDLLCMVMKGVADESIRGKSSQRNSRVCKMEEKKGRHDRCVRRGLCWNKLAHGFIFYEPSRWRQFSQTPEMHTSSNRSYIVVKHICDLPFPWWKTNLARLHGKPFSLSATSETLRWINVLHASLLMQINISYLEAGDLSCCMTAKSIPPCYSSTLTHCWWMTLLR